MKNKNEIFREKSLERVSSPEQLDKYIRTTTPSTWIILASIIVLLVGVIVWATVGKIISSSECGYIVSNHQAVCYVSEENYEKINGESYFEIDNLKIDQYKITGPDEASEVSGNYAFHASNISNGQWYYTITFNVNIADGEYNGKVVYEEISPITFVIN